MHLQEFKAAVKLVAESGYHSGIESSASPIRDGYQCGYGFSDYVVMWECGVWSIKWTLAELIFEGKGETFQSANDRIEVSTKEDF